MRRQQAENLANWAKRLTYRGWQAVSQTRGYDNQQGQSCLRDEVVAENSNVGKPWGVREGHTVGAYSPQLQTIQHLQIQYQTFSRDENPFGANNPLDISDDDLPF